MIKAIFSHLVDSVLNTPQPSSPTSNQSVTSPVQNSPFKTSTFIYFILIVTCMFKTIEDNRVYKNYFLGYINVILVA